MPTITGVLGALDTADLRFPPTHEHVRAASPDARLRGSPARVAAVAPGQERPEERDVVITPTDRGLISRSRALRG